MNVTYKTPRQFCEAVSAIKDLPTQEFTKRPKFRFKPDECAWWLVPSTDNPHYKHGKFIFNWTDYKKKTSLSAGLHIEKGLDEQLAAVYSSKKASRFIADESWYWNWFITNVKGNSYFENLKDIFANFNDIQITIDGGYVSEPTKFDPYQDKSLGWDKYSFLWKQDNTLEISDVKRNAFILKMHHIKSIEDLKKYLQEISTDAWLWLNIYITVNFDISTAGASEIEIWNSSLKYMNELIYLKPYFINHS